jgi:hypothetical protein
MKVIFLSIISLVVITNRLHAQYVSPKNGNLNVNYTDIAYEDSTSLLAITRTYNSKAIEIGWFGAGWGSIFETSIQQIPGGGLIINQWGAGSKEIFQPGEWDRQDISSAVEKIIQIAEQEGEVQTPEETAALKTALIEEEEKRATYWIKYAKKGLVKNTLLKEFSKLSSTSTAGSYVEVLKSGYKYFDQDGSIYLFDEKGRVIRLTDEKGAFANVFYNNNFQPDSMQDNFGNRLHLFFNEDGLIQKLVSIEKNGKKDSAVYKHDKNLKTLTSSLDVDSNYYRFEWDNNFCLTKILYEDTTEVNVQYDENLFVKKFSRRNGSYTAYAYPWVSENEYGNSNSEFDSTGKLIKSISHWYVLKTNNVGAQWVYKWIIVSNGDSTTYINNEKLGYADTVYLNGGYFYAYKYDNKGLLRSINNEKGLLVSVTSKNDKLTEIITAGNKYKPVYENEQVTKLVARDGEEISLPLNEPYDKLTGKKADVLKVIPAFFATSYWWDLHINDTLLKAARKMK